jgi:Bacterial membrane protein YfhO
VNWSWIYIGALYAAAVWLARRRGVDLRRRVAVFFFALVVLFFFKPLTQHYVMTEDDFLNMIPPWHFTAKVKTSINGELNDVPLQHTPWGVQVRENWKSGRLPLWNNLNGSGYPLLANGQSQALSPIRFLALPVPTTYFMATEAAMKILIALTFAFLFIRGRGYSELASVVGACIFGFGGFLHSWLHFPHVTTAVFLPAVLYLIDRIVEEKTFVRFAGAAFVWTAILFGGHPETASHIFFLSLLYLAWIVFVEKRTTWRIFLTLGGAMSIAAMLSAPFLLPFLEALPKSQRYQELKMMPLDRESLPYTDKQSMTVLFQAHFFGRAPIEEPWGPAVTEPVGGFASVLGIASFFALLVSVIRRHAWRSTELFFVIATVIVFGVINGWPFIGDAIHAVLPVVAHARFRMLWIMLMGIQAAAAIDLTQRGERAPLAIGAAIVGAMLVALFATTHFPDAARQATAVATSMRSVAVLVLATLFALVARWRKPVLLLLLVAVNAELWPVTRGWNVPHPAEAMYPRTEFVRAYEALKEKNPPNSFRVIGVGAMNYPNTNVIYGIEEARAHDPMSYDRYMGFLGLVAGLKTGPQNYHPWYEDSDASALDFLNVKYLVQDAYYRAPDPERWKLIFQNIEGKIFENTRVMPRFYAVRNVVILFEDDHFFRRLKEHTDWANTGLLEKLELESQQQHDDFFHPRPANSPLAVAKIVETAPTAYRVHVSAPRWSLIVSSIPWWPGWKVVRNGETIKPIRVNGAFLGFAVPPGEADVRVYYSPWTWWVGVGLAVAGLLVLAFMRTRQRTAG